MKTERRIKLEATAAQWVAQIEKVLSDGLLPETDGQMGLELAMNHVYQLLLLCFQFNINPLPTLRKYMPHHTWSEVSVKDILEHGEMIVRSFRPNTCVWVLPWESFIIAIPRVEREQINRVSFLAQPEDWTDANRLSYVGLDYLNQRLPSTIAFSVQESAIAIPF